MTPPWVLFANSGIQFIDAFITIAEHSPACAFIRTGSQGPICQVFADNLGKYYYRGTSEQAPEYVRPEYQFTLVQSLTLLANHWIPLPFIAEHQRVESPETNWVRLFISDDPQVTNRWKITFAVDTSELSPPKTCTSPSKVRYPLCQNVTALQQFMLLPWVSEWVSSIYQSYSSSEPPHFLWQAHYLNLINAIINALGDCTIEIAHHTANDIMVATDVIVDLGNTNSCGIIYENSSTENSPFTACSEIMLRDLSHPNQPLCNLFSSEVIFANSPFGNRGLSAASGRYSAFTWPTLVRIGPEAERLAKLNQQIVQRQGLSVPRRYLWDDNAALQPWYRYSPEGSTALAALGQKMSALLNDQGELLSDLPCGERIPLFSPHFTRRNLLMLTLTELFMQLLVQINSVAYRSQIELPLRARYLRRIVFTLPASITQLEKQRFRQLVEQAFYLLRLNEPHLLQFNWPTPTLSTAWDEGSCGQFFWLWQQLNQQSLVSLLKAYRQRLPADRLRIGLIDIGGGTSDLAITDYRINATNSEYPALRPQLRLRQGFNCAGDTLLQDIANQFLLPQLGGFLETQGCDNAHAFLQQCFAPTTQRDSENAWTYYVTRHLVIPVVNDLLQRYQLDEHDYFCRVSQLIGSETITRISEYMTQLLMMREGNAPRLDFTHLTLTLTLQELDHYLRGQHCRVAEQLKVMCDTVTEQGCDILLLSGQVTSLPALQRVVHQCCIEKPIRIIPLANMATATFLPFCQNGKLANSKHVTALGALVYSLIEQQQLCEQGIVAGEIESLTPPRWYGKLENNGLIDNVLISPSAVGTVDKWVTLNRAISLGYRCSSQHNVAAFPLFSLRPQREKINDLTLGISVLLAWQFSDVGELVTLPRIVEIRDHQQRPLCLDVVKLEWNTLALQGEPRISHWRDDGRFILADR